ncbi:MAG: sulfatase-like hydrolase/transferase [Saprospiraceae bacterium]|nr:sulfatase-like hydrolase/transferase [Saprospiraceae bacterium]
MLKGLAYFFRLAVFWLGVFNLYRVLMVAFSAESLLAHPRYLPGQAALAGLRLDASTMVYLMMPAFLLWAGNQWRPHKIFALLNKGFHYVVLCVLALLYVASLTMYHEWPSLLSASALEYARKPGQMLAFISTGELLGLLLFMLVYSATMILLYRKWVIGFGTRVAPWYNKLLLTLAAPVAFGIGARGGLQLIPINESSAYFSQTPFFNHLAVNPFWYFVHSALDREQKEHPYIFMDAAAAEVRNKRLFVAADTLSQEVLNRDRPNVVIILLESWTADIIESMGGEPGVTPFFDSLRREGILFTQIYGAGQRTEHGLISVFSGFAPPPRVSIITVPSKSAKLPNINAALSDEGYSSSFYYGGEIGFVNMKSYLLNGRFQEIVDKSSFSSDQLNSKWGAHDQYAFEKQLAGLRTMQQPFLSGLLTLSTHEPFDVPMDTPFDAGHGEADRFKKSAYYTDRCLSAYFRQAKREAWYPNTLFILVADHGHRLPRNTDLTRPESKRIPVLFFGPVVKESYRGVEISRTGNQHDLPVTLLNQLKRETSSFPGGRDLLNPSTMPFAYYTTDHVMGWVTPAQSLVYDYARKEWKPVDGLRVDSSTYHAHCSEAEAYLQHLYGAYLEK